MAPEAVAAAQEVVAAGTKLETQTLLAHMDKAPKADAETKEGVAVATADLRLLHRDIALKGAVALLAHTDMALKAEAVGEAVQHSLSMMPVLPAVPLTAALLASDETYGCVPLMFPIPPLDLQYAKISLESDFAYQ
jgi:hypothetical protein